MRSLEKLVRRGSLPCALGFAAMLAACEAPDRPLTPGISPGIIVDSDPRGAQIFLNGRDTGLSTPDTLRDLDVGRYNLLLLLDSAEMVYWFAASIETQRDTTIELLAPLLIRCVSLACVMDLVSFHDRAGIRFAQNVLGIFLQLRGEGNGLFWPQDSGNSYASTGSPVFAGVLAGTGDTVALGPYDWEYMLSRPAPRITDETNFALRQTSWVAPPADLLYRSTVRGLAIRQQLVASPDVPGVLLLRLVFENISHRREYRTIDPLMPSEGITYQSAYIGLALDGDVGSADDDLLGYHPELDLAFIYDADFNEPTFFEDWAQKPGLIGLRALEKPPGTDVILNGWVRELPGAQPGDWIAGRPNESMGWGFLSGSHTVLPNHPDPRIGFIPTSPVDVRVSVSAGPLTLAPGDSATITVAIVLAEPEPGSYTSGTVVPPGDPFDTDRALLQVARRLLERAESADALLLLLME